MAIGYQYRACTDFPELLDQGRAISLNPQRMLIGYQYQPAHSVLAYEYSLDYKGYHKYRVIHETLRNMRVRFEDRLLEAVIEQINFEMYLAPDRTHVFVAAKSSICDELLKRAKETYRGFEFTDREIDLMRVNRESAQHISGGWFNELKIADVSAAALFGAEVSESSDWERYAEEGKITILHMNYQEDVSKGSYQVTVSRKGGIVVFNKLSEDVRVELLDKISRAIEPYATVKSTRTKR